MSVCMCQCMYQCSRMVEYTSLFSVCLLYYHSWMSAYILCTYVDDDDGINVMCNFIPCDRQGVVLADSNKICM